MKHVHNEFPNFVESYDAHSNTDQRTNFIEMLLVSGMGGKVIFLSYTLDYMVCISKKIYYSTQKFNQSSYDIFVNILDLKFDW